MLPQQNKLLRRWLDHCISSNLLCIVYVSKCTFLLHLNPIINTYSSTKIVWIVRLKCSPFHRNPFVLIIVCNGVWLYHVKVSISHPVQWIHSQYLIVAVDLCITKFSLCLHNHLVLSRFPILKEKQNHKITK